MSKSSYRSQTSYGDYDDGSEDYYDESYLDESELSGSLAVRVCVPRCPRL